MDYKAEWDVQLNLVNVFVILSKCVNKKMECSSCFFAHTRSVQKVFSLFSLANGVRANCLCEGWMHTYAYMRNHEAFQDDLFCHSFSVKRLLQVRDTYSLVYYF